MASLMQYRFVLFLLAATILFPERTKSAVLKDEKNHSDPCTCVPVQKSFNETIKDQASAQCRKCYKFTYEFTKDQDWAANLCIQSPVSSINSPLLIAVRESLSVMSFQVPQMFSSGSVFKDVCHTLCPLGNYFDTRLQPGQQTIYVEISTSSNGNVPFQLEMATINDFIMVKEHSLTVNITPSQPRIMQYNMDKSLRAVRIEATSNDKNCMILAIQDIKCPFYDSERTIEHAGFYQTLTRQSGIAITRKTFQEGRLYIVLFLKPIDSNCIEPYEAETIVSEHRSKEVTVKIVPAITDAEYYEAVFGAFGFFILIYIFSFVICCFLFVRRRRSNAESQTVNVECPSIQTYGTSPDHEITSRSLDEVGARRCSTPDLDETDMDKLPDAKLDKNVVRTKTVLYVSDLSRKNDRYLSERTKVYSWNLLTIAIFYGLPVVQLVYINQRIVNVTGNQDLCYYNFLCSHQVWVFSDFNHVYSNIGYVMLGILFLLLVCRRDALDSYKFKTPQPQLTGIPQHFGLLYAMGWALIMEGILSASYHVCPNRANFQFDTAFMYVIATVCMLKLYQARHPDITAKSHTTWMVLSIVVIIGVGGVLKGGIIFWLLFACAHLTVTFLVSAKIYYMGRCKINRWIFKRMYQNIKMDIAAKSFTPVYPGRFIVLGTAVLLNVGVDLYGLIRQPPNFAAFLLAVFIMNLLMYLSYYTIMKLRYKEGIRWIPTMYIILSFACWGAALHFFLAKNTSWQVTPAQSRERNKHCLILNFFDHHDIWHFLSSCALFFSFMVLFTLDDNLEMTPRTKIVVF